MITYCFTVVNSQLSHSQLHLGFNQLNFKYEKITTNLPGNVLDR